MCLFSTSIFYLQMFFHSFSSLQVFGKRELIGLGACHFNKLLVKGLETCLILLLHHLVKSLRRVLRIFLEVIFVKLIVIEIHAKFSFFLSNDVKSKSICSQINKLFGKIRGLRKTTFHFTKLICLIESFSEKAPRQS